MARKFSQLRAATEATVAADPERQARRQEYRRAMADALALGRLRESRGETQRQVALSLGVTQANVSRIEHQPNPYLSTLRDYVEALGGRLEVAAVFPDQRVILTDGRGTREQGAPESHYLLAAGTLAATRLDRSQNVGLPNFIDNTVQGAGGPFSYGLQGSYETGTTQVSVSYDRDLLDAITTRPKAQDVERDNTMERPEGFAQRVA